MNPRRPASRNHWLIRLVIEAGMFAAVIAAAPFASAQVQLNPVYVDDSPIAADTLARVKDFLSSGNLDEAVRVLQVLLDEHTARMTQSAGDVDVFVSVRTRVNGVLLDNAALLGRYRALEGPRAQAELESGNVDRAEQSHLLTTAGMEAALRLAQRQLENAQFEAARQTLEQLESHPDRIGTPGAGAGDKAASLGKAAADLLATVARYINRPEIWDRAERWARQAAGSDQPRTAQPWPDRALCRGQSPLDQLPELSVNGLISKPLWSIAIGPNNPAAVELPGPGITTRGQGAIPPNAHLLEMLPTACDDLLVINDGSVVSAWDRFTLSPRWTLQPSGAGPARVDDREDDRVFGIPRRAWYGGSVTSLDPLTVTIRGRHGAVATGRAGGAGREGDDRVHGFDARAGRIRWTRLLSDIDPGLSDATVRGPLEIDQGVVIVAARKHLPDRRLLSLTLIGLDADTGRTLWQRPIGSAGWLPFAAQNYGPEGGVVDRGVIYRSDRLGIAAAVETVSGRTVWSRRMPTDAGSVPQSEAQAWEVSRPIIDDTIADKANESIVIIAPDQKRLVRLDATNGRVLAETAAGRFAQPAPAYLLRVGDSLAAVPASTPGIPAPNKIAVVPLREFDTAIIKTTPQFDPPGVWGRVSVVGDKLLAPIVGGLAIVDVKDPAAAPLVQALDEPGNVLALGRQLLVIDDSRAHSYLQWETAESILTERIKADPKDPSPAVTFAELAYRAGRPDRISQSVDAAISAIKSEPEAERSRAARERLFDALNAMVNSGLDPAEPSTAAAGTPSTGTNASRARGAIAPRIEDRSLLAALVERLGQVASTADDRVAVAMAAGRLAEQQPGAGPDQAISAAASYQRVLDDPQLATANWRGASVSVRGELEAARRLEQLIAKFGPSVYAAQEQECQRRLAELGDNAPADKLEQLVTRFPLAASTPEAYLKLNTALRKAEGARSATTALELGLRAAQRIKTTPPAVSGELAGRLVTELRTKKQTQAAAAVLRNVKKFFPAATLTADGQTLDAAAIEADLARSITAGARWPRIGQLTAENVQTLTGWGLLRPILREPTPHVSNCLMMETEREVAVWTIDGGTGALTKGWSRRIDEAGAALIKTTPEAAYVLVRGNRSGGVEKVSLIPEGKGWKTESFAKLFPPDETTRGLNRAPGAMGDQFETPDDGFVPADDLIVAMDERTLALVQRGGRITALDTDTGEVLWSGSTPVARVYDAQVVGGTLVIAGDAGKPDGAGAIQDVSATVQVVDARTGRLGQRLGDLEARTRWVRLTDEGALICGLENKIISIDLATSQRNWTIESSDVMPAAAAWVFGDRLLLMSTDRSLWLASVATGRLNPKSLETPRSHIDSTRELDAYLTTGNADGPFAVATQQGIMIFGPAGELDGVDGLGGIDAMIPPRAAEDYVVSIETISSGRGGDGTMQFAMHQLENRGGMLAYSKAVQLAARPIEMELLDGKIAVTAGAVTVIIDAPPGRSK